MNKVTHSLRELAAKNPGIAGELEQVIASIERPKYEDLHANGQWLVCMLMGDKLKEFNDVDLSTFDLKLNGVSVSVNEIADNVDTIVETAARKMLEERAKDVMMATRKFEDDTRQTIDDIAHHIKSKAFHLFPLAQTSEDFR